MNVWRLITHHKSPKEALAWTKRNDRLAIGWGNVGDINGQAYASAREVTASIKRCYPDLRNSGQGGINIWNFCFSMQVGDLVILSTSGKRVLVMEVTGEYEYRPGDAFDDYYHQRAARVVQINPDTLWNLAGRQACPGQSIRWALVKCANPISLATRNGLEGTVQRGKSRASFGVQPAGMKFVVG